MSAARTLDLSVVVRTGGGRFAGKPRPALVNLQAAAGPVARPETARPARRAIDGLAFYRRHTEGLLRKYMAMSMQMGRTPSVLGSCMFRGKISSYRVRSFEDAVIFVLDVERCMQKLDALEQEVVARIALQEYTQAETAALTGRSARSIFSKYGEALDRLTGIFLKVGLLTGGVAEDRQGD